MESVSENNKIVTVSEALTTLMALEQQIRVAGAVDSEPDEIEEIRQSLMRGDITPKQAVQKVEILERGRPSHYR